MAASARVVIYGGKGALGAACVSFFKSKGWWVASIDLFPNEAADANIIVTELDSWQKQDNQVYERVGEVLQGEKANAILCVAGGWAGGSANSKDLIKNSDLMWKQSVWTSTISARLAANYLAEGGLLQLTGAAPALSGTAGMMGYGMAKAAVQQLTQSLGAPKSGLPANSSAVAILPVTLDTPMNRKFMANADFTSWTPLEFLASTFLDWSNGKDRPSTGSLVKVTTVNGETSLTPIEK